VEGTTGKSNCFRDRRLGSHTRHSASLPHIFLIPLVLGKVLVGRRHPQNTPAIRFWTATLRLGEGGFGLGLKTNIDGAPERSVKAFKLSDVLLFRFVNQKSSFVDM
jgi:hypothetical protein